MKWNIKKMLSICLSLVMLMQIVPTSVYAISAENLSNKIDEMGYSTEVDQNGEVVVLEEDISKRDSSNIKYFKMSDGSTKAVFYKYSVHFLNNENEWQDIDNTLVNSKYSANDDFMDYEGVETKENNIKIKFAKNSKQNKLFSIKKDNYSLNFKLLTEHNNKEPISLSNLEKAKKSKNDNKMFLANISENICYKNILPHTNIEYIVSGESLKENIVIKKRQNKYKYKFEIKVKDVSLILGDNGNIYANDNTTGKNIFILPKPFMYDNLGKISLDVKYKLETIDNNRYILNIIPNNNWINDKSRSFPVTIDPAIITEESNTAIDSVYVSSGDATQNKWTDPMIMIGKDSSGLGKCQGLIRFNLPDIKRGDVIISAKLRGNQTYSSAYSSNTPDASIEVHAVTSGWDKKKVTWNTKPSYDNITADFEVLKASQMGNTTIEREWDVTSIVKRWYEDPSFSNNGFLLRSSSEKLTTNKDSCIYMWLYGEKYSQHTAGYPVLEITFASNKGIEPYWDYTNLDVGRAGTASICNFTGNLVFTHKDTTTPGSRFPVTIAHVFNNYMAGDSFGTIMPYRGHGWMLSCQQQLLPSSKLGLQSSAQNIYPYVYIDGDGTEHYFKKVNGELIDEDGMGLKLTIPKTNNNDYYKITDKEGNIIWFNIAGGLARILDTNNNQIANYYTSATVNKLKKVSDGAGNIVTMSPTSDDLAISSITDQAGRVTNFSWRLGQLVRITYPDGKITNFTYDNDGAMTSVKAPDGYELQFSYSELSRGKRVTKIIERTNTQNGQTITFDYSKPGTTIIRTSGKDGVYGNSDDIFTTMKFDNAGRTISSESTSNNESLASVSNEFTSSNSNSNGSNIKQLNKLSRSMTGGSFIKNYLREGSADRGGYWLKSQWNGTANYDAWVTSTDQLYGRWSYYINSKSMDSRAGARAYQTLTTNQFETSKTYTFSAWVKTKNVAALNSDPAGAEIMATYWLPDNSTKDFHSEKIVGTTDVEINNGWRKVSVTFNVPINATQIRCNIMLRNCTGEAWFDGMQLEEGTCANKFNHISNPSFERYNRAESGAYLPEDWYGYNTDAHDSVDNSHSKDAGHAFRFWSLPNMTKEFSQVINLLGNSAENLDDTYIVSGWVYSNPVGGNNENNKISICAKVTYTDGTYCRNWFDFNSSVSGWQYIMGAFTLRDVENKTAAKTPERITIHLIDYRQSNNSWFDNIQLVKDDVPSYTYDKDGNLISIMDNAEQKSNMIYSNNKLTNYKDPKGYDYKYTYDNNHNMTQATSQRGTRYCYNYDNYGNPTALSIKGSNTMSIDTNVTYSANGAYALSVKDEDAYEEKYTYNENTGTINSYVDKAGNQTDFTYDFNTNNLTSISQTLSNGDVVLNSYSYENNHLKTITHNDFSYNFDYDSFGRTTQTRIGNNVLCSNIYNINNGCLDKIEYGNGDYVNYNYDDYGNVKEILLQGNKSYVNNYNSWGNLTDQEDLIHDEKKLYSYDYTGRLISQSLINMNTNKTEFYSEYGYDKNNNICKTSINSGNQSMVEKYSYGKDNLVSSYTMPSDKIITYRYDSLLRRNRELLNTQTPVEHRWLYHMSNRGGDIRTTKIGWEYFNNELYLYNYDARGNIVEILRSPTGVESSAVRINHYEYDELNRLVRADDLDKNSTEVYSYDKGGNILSVITYPLSWGSLDSVSPIDSKIYSYGDTNWKDKLTEYNGQAITYDEIGNPLTYKDMNLTWKNGRQLSNISKDNLNIEYSYDIDGLRKNKTVNGVKHEYYYVGSKLRCEKYENIELWFSYNAEGRPSSIRYKNGETINDYYLICNVFGDVIKIYNDEGTLASEYKYDSWGNVISVVDKEGKAITDSRHIANVNPLRYRGYYYDTELGMYYLQSRYYDPEVKRFINADSLFVSNENIKGTNMFAYCLNNPIMLVDSNGHASTLAHEMANIIVIVGYLQFIADHAENDSNLCYFSEYIERAMFWTNSLDDIRKVLKKSVDVLSGNDAGIKKGYSMGISVGKKLLSQKYNATYVNDIFFILENVVAVREYYYNPYIGNTDFAAVCMRQVILAGGNLAISASGAAIAGALSTAAPGYGTCIGIVFSHYWNVIGRDAWKKLWS